MLTTGALITNDDDFSGTVTADNVVRHLLSAGKTWKAYEEDLPKAGYIRPDVAKYARRHCPLSYLSDVYNSSSEKLNLVPFTQFTKDLSNDSFPDFSFITPNLCNDAHDCSLGTADGWLKTHIAPLIQSSTCPKGELFITVLDDSASDTTHGRSRRHRVATSPKYPRRGT